MRGWVAGRELPRDAETVWRWKWLPKRFADWGSAALKNMSLKGLDRIY